MSGKRSSPRIARALIALMRTSCFTTAPWSAILTMTSLKPSAWRRRLRFSWQKARFPAVCSALLFTSSAPLRTSSYTAQAHWLSSCTRHQHKKGGQQQRKRQGKKKRKGKIRKRVLHPKVWRVAFLGDPRRPPNDWSLSMHKTESWWCRTDVLLTSNWNGHLHYSWCIHKTKFKRRRSQRASGACDASQLPPYIHTSAKYQYLLYNSFQWWHDRQSFLLTRSQSLYNHHTINVVHYIVPSTELHGVCTFVCKFHAELKHRVM